MVSEGRQQFPRRQRTNTIAHCPSLQDCAITWIRYRESCNAHWKCILKPTVGTEVFSQAMEPISELPPYCSAPGLESRVPRQPITTGQEIEIARQAPDSPQWHRGGFVEMLTYNDVLIRQGGVFENLLCLRCITARHFPEPRQAESRPLHQLRNSGTDLRGYPAFVPGGHCFAVHSEVRPLLATKVHDQPVQLHTGLDPISC